MRLLTLSLTLCVLLAAAALPAAAQQASVLQGSVEFADSKAPAAGIAVQLVSEDTNQKLKVTADKKGHYIKLGIRPGRYHAIIECDGYMPVVVTEISVDTNAHFQIPALKLVPSSSAPNARQVLRCSTGQLSTEPIARN